METDNQYDRLLSKIDEINSHQRRLIIFSERHKLKERALLFFKGKGKKYTEYKESSARKLVDPASPQTDTCFPRRNRIPIRSQTTLL